MQDKKIIDCFTLSVPLELFEEAGIEPDGLMEMTAQNGRIVITVPDETANISCDGDCRRCPISRVRCGKRARMNVRCK